MTIKLIIIIYQHNFKGTSNVYSPAIYRTKEKFEPLNAFDDKHDKYTKYAKY